LPLFNNKIKKVINRYLSEKVGFEKLCQEDENLKKYFTQWKQIPIDNYQEYISFIDDLSNDKEITNEKQQEYNEIILKSNFKILLNNNQKKICIMLDSADAEKVRDDISKFIDDNENLYISSQKSYYVGDEDWIDYFEGDEGDAFNAIATLSGAKINKNILSSGLSKIKSGVKNAYHNYKNRNVDIAQEIPRVTNLAVKESFIKKDNRQKLNEIAFIPVAVFLGKFLGQVIVWSIAESFFKKYLMIPDSNWIESRKLYVFDYNDEIDNINDIIDDYQNRIDTLKKQYGGIDPTEITDKVIDIFKYFLENIENFARENNLPLANNTKKLEIIKKDINMLEDISNSDNKLKEFRSFLKLDKNKKSVVTVSLLKNFKKIVNEKDIDLESDTDVIVDQIFEYYLEKFNENR
jgi:flavodoxin